MPVQSAPAERSRPRRKEKGKQSAWSCSVLCKVGTKNSLAESFCPPALRAEQAPAPPWRRRQSRPRSPLFICLPVLWQGLG